MFHFGYIVLCDAIQDEYLLGFCSKLIPDIQTMDRGIMVRITIYAIGKIKEASQRDAGAVYTKRISSFCPIECIEYPEASIQDGNASSLFLAMQKEGQLLCNRISGDDFVIALDRMGKQISSETFSHLIGDCEINGPYQICFLIGGPHGLSDACKKRADYLLSLSTLTFPHQLVRLMLYEQVYRAFTILRGLPYHR